ncbi:MAG TPA: MBL fold metallo-hydrolase [Candidatus Sulfotelmatobacter sp.]|nr:MBL fold metallo-hydrolase [Candidatus Sulfotelmatobacter sp.]
MKYTAAGTSAALAGATWWVTASRQRAARWARRLIEDAQRRIVPAPAKPDPVKWSDNQITLCWLGHTTVLINFYGLHILTDPALGSRVGISLGLGTAGPKRYIAPALRPKELPPIDVVLLSHAHMDHMDLPTLRHFAPSTFTISAKETADVLAGAGLKHITELAWNQRTIFRNAKGELQVEAFEVRHWGQRWPSELVRGYNGYVLRREGKALLFGGDTARTSLFADIRSAGPYQAAIMPIGAYQPWVWNHCTPEQALEMANAARARYLVPVHHQTFRLSEEPMNEPIERLQHALAKEPERLALRQVGETFVVPKA